MNALGYTEKETDRKLNHQKSVHTDHHLIRYNMSTLFYIWRVEGKSQSKSKTREGGLGTYYFEGTHELKTVLASK